jgi:hypothetical protein
MLEHTMDWRELFNYGLPTAMLSVMTYGLWKVAVWARVKVVEPVVTAHLRLIQTMQDTIPQLMLVAGDNKQKAEEIAQLAALSSAEANERLDKIEAAIKAQTRTIDTQTKVIQGTIETQTDELRMVEVPAPRDVRSETGPRGT